MNRRQPKQRTPSQNYSINRFNRFDSSRRTRANTLLDANFMTDLELSELTDNLTSRNEIADQEFLEGARIPSWRLLNQQRPQSRLSDVTSMADIENKKRNKINLQKSKRTKVSSGRNTALSRKRTRNT